eukprot:UN28481
MLFIDIVCSNTKIAPFTLDIWTLNNPFIPCTFQLFLFIHLFFRFSIVSRHQYIRFLIFEFNKILSFWTFHTFSF